MKTSDGKISEPYTGVISKRVGPCNDAKSFFHGREEADGYDQGSNPRQMEKGRVQETFDDVSGDSRPGHPHDQGEPEISDESEREETDVSAQGVNAGVSDVKDP